MTFRERLRERIAVLNEVLDDIREKKKEWAPFESAVKSLTDLEKDIEKKVKATAETWRTSG